MHRAIFIDRPLISKDFEQVIKERLAAVFALVIFSFNLIKNDKIVHLISGVLFIMK